MASKMLVVDDSATMRRIIKKVVRKAGLPIEDDIHEAGNGLEALERLSVDGYDIILCDINMPEMNGLEFVKEARSQFSDSKMTIVMLSTESSEAVVSDAIERGANGFITKPFTPEQISEALSKYVS